MRVKLTWIDLIVLVPIGCVLIALMMPIGDFDFAHRYPPAASQPAIDLAGNDGEYYLGNGRGMNLRLSILPDGRYSFVSSGCTGLHHRESGYVQEAKGQYLLSPSGPIEPGVERSLVPIGWGQRRYLIPPADMQRFRDAIVEGQEPRDDVRGRFYVRLPVLPADGLPNSPRGLANDLCENLLLGRVLEVSAVGLAKIGRARVDLGAAQGIRDGDVLTVQRGGSAWHRRLRVVFVEKGSCLADECFPGASEHALEPGQAVVAVKNTGEIRQR
jgi:hypothetical protein